MSVASIDTDIVLKCVAYGLSAGDVTKLGYDILVIGTTRFTVGSRLRRMHLDTDRAAALKRAEDFFGIVSIIEPTADELSLAADLEHEAQKAILPLDTGESQLIAVTIRRHLDLMVTGDKRAIRAMEQLLDDMAVLGEIAGKVVCLEQLMARLLKVVNQTVVRAGVCAEPSVDKTMSICFSCGRDGTSAPDWEQGVASYVQALRTEAPRILATCCS